MSKASSSEPARPAAFFDRDGVLNVDGGYAHDPEKIVIIPGAVDAVRLCNQAGYHVFVVTNQSGVARGLFDEMAVRRFNQILMTCFGELGARIDDVRYCPHHPQGAVAAYRVECECRKPRAGMILDLIRAWDVKRSRSFLVGDKDSDLEAARAAGIAGALYRGGPLDELVSSLLNQMNG